MEPPDETRSTDYGEDVAATESGPASARVDPDMTARVRKTAIVAVVALALAFVAVSIDRYVKYRRVARATDEAATALPAVDVISAQPVGAVQRLVLPGQTAAWHTSTIYARVNGYVGKWFVDIGDAVHRGQVLALIETPDLDAQLAAARAQLRAGAAQELVRKAEVELSRTTYERWRDSPKGVVSEQEREEKRADYESAEARVKSAQADVALDQAHVDQYTALAQFKEVTAPYDGVITNRDIDIGNLVTAGSTSTTTPLYVMTQNDPIRIFVDVPQSAAADLVDGATVVQIQSGTAGGREYTAKLTRTSHAVDLQARTVRAEVDIPNASQQFVPGMYLKVAFALAPKGLVQVPAAALLFRAAGPQVAQVDASGRLSFRNVTIARDDGSVVELASGVAPGDHLALNVSSQIRDGEQVSARQLDGTAVTASTAAGR
ncbi:MAG TPA: efflux RND transporter periplasmic adaptor subunit [Steroidobacteraceae bacterium]